MMPCVRTRHGVPTAVLGLLALPLLWSQAWPLSLSDWMIACTAAGPFLGWLWLAVAWLAVLTGLHGVPGLPRALRQRRVRQIHLHTMTCDNGCHQRRNPNRYHEFSSRLAKEKFSTQRHLWSRPLSSSHSGHPEAACGTRDPARTPTTPVTEAPTACPDPFAGPEPSRTSVQKRSRVPGLAGLFGFGARRE